MLRSRPTGADSGRRRRSIVAIQQLTTLWPPCSQHNQDEITGEKQHDHLCVNISSKAALHSYYESLSVFLSPAIFVLMMMFSVISCLEAVCCICQRSTEKLIANAKRACKQFSKNDSEQQRVIICDLLSLLKLRFVDSFKCRSSCYSIRETFTIWHYLVEHHGVEIWIFCGFTDDGNPSESTVNSYRSGIDARQGHNKQHCLFVMFMRRVIVIRVIEIQQTFSIFRFRRSQARCLNKTSKPASMLIHES